MDIAANGYSNSEEDLILNNEKNCTKDCDRSTKTSYKHELAHWAVKHNVSQTAVSALLQLNRKYMYNHSDDLPKDARTLLKTTRKTTTVPVAGGHYYHIGIAHAISNVLQNSCNLTCGLELLLQLNIDGIPIYKSSSSSLWPILGRLVNNGLNNNVFAIGAFYGGAKPLSIHEFLAAFIDEYLQLRKDGMMIYGYNVTLKIHTVMCDAPARAQVKCVTQFSGYYGCDKCTISGQYRHGSVKFVEMKTPPGELVDGVTLREDHTFHSCVGHPGHHRGRSPFLQTEVGKLKF